MDPVLNELSTLVQELSATNGSLDKIRILRQHPQLRDTVRLILDPLLKTGITRNGLIKYEQQKFPKYKFEHKRYPQTIDTILQALVAKKYSGDEAKEVVLAACKRLPQHRELILDAAEKDLKTRLGMGLYRQAYDTQDDDDKDSEADDDAEGKESSAKKRKVEKPVKYQPTLAFDITKHQKFFDASIKAGDTWKIARKLDGVRAQVWTTEAGAEAKSREGRPFASLAPLQDLVRQHVPAGYVLDGEVCVIEEDGSESFKKAVSHVKRKQPMHNFCYYVFDVLTHDEFNSGKGALNLSQRLSRLHGFKGLLGNFIEQVEMETFTSESFAKWQARAAESGWEGLMLRRDAPYVGKRTKDLLKVKQFFTEEYVIQQLDVGPFRMINPKTGLEEGREMVTAVQILHKNQPVSVGSGFSLAERIAMHAHPEKYIGQTISVQYFEESQDKDGKVSLRFPTFKAWHGKTRTT